MTDTDLLIHHHLGCENCDRHTRYDTKCAVETERLRAALISIERASDPIGSWAGDSQAPEKLVRIHREAAAALRPAVRPAKEVRS